MQVPTTETIIDRQKFRKELERSIVELTELERIARESFSGHREIVESFKNQKEILTQEISSLGCLLKETSQSVSEFIKESSRIPKDIQYLILEHFNVLKDVLARIDSETLNLKEIISQKESVMTEILAQRLVFDTYRKDLDIYKNRLDTIISENNLNIKINL